MPSKFARANRKKDSPRRMSHWLAGEDSNLHSRLQKPVSCHWTTGHQHPFYDIMTEEFTAREAVFVYYGVGFVAGAVVSSMNRAA